MTTTKKSLWALAAFAVATVAMASTTLKNAYADTPANGPLAGYTIHVSAPHVMNGEMVGPMEHYCKAIDNEIIQCILFDGTGPNAKLTEVEYMIAKKLVKKHTSDWKWEQNWHDHQQEIDTGRVAILNPTDKKAQASVVKTVAKTDGIIFHLWPDGAPIPDGSVMIPQSVGHWEELHGKLGK